MSIRRLTHQGEQMKRFLPLLLLTISILFVVGIAWRTFAQSVTNVIKDETDTVDNRKANTTGRGNKKSKSKVAVKPPPSFQSRERVPIDKAVDFPADI